MSFWCLINKPQHCEPTYCDLVIGMLCMFQVIYANNLRKARKVDKLVENAQAKKFFFWESLNAAVCGTKK